MALANLSTWGAILEGAQDHQEDLYERIIEEVERRDPPDTTHRFKKITTKSGHVFGLVGSESRRFLTFESEAGDLSRYELNINVEPFGRVLSVQAALRAEEDLGITGSLQSWYEQELSWEAQQMLSTWASVLFGAIKDATRGIAEEVGKDPGKLKSETEGVLSVW